VCKTQGLKSNQIYIPKTPTQLAQKDIVFLYLAQDGVFQQPNKPNYGSLLSKTNAGTWQINRVTNTFSNGTVVFECDLNPAFYNVGSSSNYYRMVVTKILLADVLSVGAITMRPKAFVSGGGIVAIIANSIKMSSGSKISADGVGFSGGTRASNGNPCSNCSGCSNKNYFCSDPKFGGQRGASIAPYSENPLVRGNCRGALANGGGGGNNHNSAGGGGANVCANPKALDWTGDGVRL